MSITKRAHILVQSMRPTGLMSSILDGDTNDVLHNIHPCVDPSERHRLPRERSRLRHPNQRRRSQSIYFGYLAIHQHQGITHP